MSEMPPPPRAVSGKVVLLAGAGAIVALAVATMLAVPPMLKPYYKERPRQARAMFDAVQEAILQYSVDYAGALPPETDHSNLRRRNRNISKTRGWGITGYAPGTVDKYLEAVSDPYALPEANVPPMYAAGRFPDGSGWFALVSPGPNLDYDTRPETLRGAQDFRDLKQRLDSHAFDPAKGPKSPGDFYRAVHVPAAGAAMPLDVADGVSGISFD